MCYYNDRMKISKNMNNQELAKLLRAMAAAYEIKEGNRFKIMAYDRAATAIEHATSEAKDLWDDKKLTSLPGIGTNIAAHLDELFRTGKVAHFEKIMKDLPPAMFELLNVSGVGAKTAYRLCQELGLKNPNTAVNDLIKAASKGKVASIEGFGERSQADVLEALTGFKKGEVKKRRMLLPYADVVAQEVIFYLKKHSSVIKVDPLGSLRRMMATVGDVDIAVATKKQAETVEWFIKYPKKKKLIEKGPSGASILLKSGHQVDLRVQKPGSYGALLQHFTGSKHHNIHLREIAQKKGWSLSEYGIKIKGKTKEFKTEEEFYKGLGMEWIPPELREDSGEIEAAQEGKLPELVKLDDIKGDLHLHSSFPIEESHDPGTESMEKMIDQAKQLGWQYLGFCEHNPSMSQHSEKKIIDLIKRKKEKIDKINYSRTKKLLKKVLNGLEIDIRPNGDLAVPEKGFDFLDYGIASIHSSFRLSRERMTRRVLKALEHPKIKILGHPTGRLLGKREGYELDWDRVFAFCKKHQKWLEINSLPNRLDLPDVLVREAVKNGVKIIVNTDSHDLDCMKLIKYGVSVARRGWASPKDVVNTLSWEKISAILNRS
jgi:DNA polymerase (family 10)